LFDKTNRVALVGDENPYIKITNPLTGVEELSLDYFFINESNNKIKIKSRKFPDSIYVFPNQEELQLNYLDSSDFFKVLFHKNGKQLSFGFDNIYQTELKSFFETENYVEVFKKNFRSKGLIDTLGNEIINCKYNKISFNKEDSVIYCCSAVFNSKSNDDVFDYTGHLLYTNAKHITFSSRHTHIMKEYEPKELYIIENDGSNKLQIVFGDEMVYLKDNNVLLINKNDWYLLDIVTLKKQKIDKESYFYNLFNLIKQ
jgi:hypothetical protein